MDNWSCLGVEAGRIQAQGIRHRSPIVGTGSSNHVDSCEMGRKEAGGQLGSYAQGMTSFIISAQDGSGSE